MNDWPRKVLLDVGDYLPLGNGLLVPGLEDMLACPAADRVTVKVLHRVGGPRMWHEVVKEAAGPLVTGAVRGD